MKQILSKDEFLNEIKEGVVIVDFYANWCSPCRMLMPVLEEVDEETEYKVIKVNVDEQTELASAFRVSSIPYLVIFKDGKQIGDSLGYLPKPNLIRLVENLISKNG